MEWLPAPDYWLSRLLLQRSLAAIYLVAFLVAVGQFRPLLGERGLLPVPRFVKVVPWRRSPSIFYLYYSDRFFAILAWSGAAVAGAVVAGVMERGPLWLSMLAWLLLWIVYLSIVNVGQSFYSFGWESLLLEAGFLAIFLGPGWMAPPLPVLWLARWLLFRVEFGAGLIKLRGDRCWRDLTCLYYHHETQPMPNPLSWFFHHLPKGVHRVEVAANHFAQLVVPFGLFAPQPIAGAAGVIVIVTQSWLVASGNFSWLNVITIVLALSAIDDAMLDVVLPIATSGSLQPSPTWHEGLVLLLFFSIVILSYWPIRNMVLPGQLMNYSFNRLHLVNTYGAFGSITRTRREVVIEATDDPRPGAETKWEEYEFKGKPGDPRRRPPQIAPYHLRLDWLMWFTALSPAYAEGWFVALARKLLENEPRTLRLLRRAPFRDARPTYIRARLYSYRFTTPRERKETGAWWARTPVGEFMPPTRLSSLQGGRDPRGL